MQRRGVMSVVGLVAMAVLVGCHSPGGALLPYTGQSITYYSTETLQTTIEVVDLRSDEVLFRMDVPPGKQLTIQFEAGKGDDPALRPDLMTFDVWNQGTKMGRPRNSMTVPTETSRRIDVYYREGIEYREEPPLAELRTDEMAEKPEWWTPEGGPMPTRDRGVTNYDAGR